MCTQNLYTFFFRNLSTLLIYILVYLLALQTVTLVDIFRGSVTAKMRFSGVF